MTRLHPRPSPWPRAPAALVGAFALIQLVPYGRAHANPPAQVQPQWQGAQTQTLFARACADCHSNATKWPWYSNVAPVSWLVQQHVEEGRQKFNVNVPGFGRAADEAAGTVKDGSMPHWTYLPMHPEARLSAAEKQSLIRGLQATFGGEGSDRD